jgi:purine nucleosidase
MSRKVLIDCDPGIDDAVALCLALLDPRLDVLAVTATAGNVDAQQASRNVQMLVERLDPPRWPRLGAALPDALTRVIDARHLHGQDGLGNMGLAVSELHHQHPSDKVINDVIRAAPGEITIIALGPLTNIARAFSREPELPSLLDRLIIMGGAVNGIGNVTPAAEFNMYCDPKAAQLVFRSPTTKTLVPLDVTNRVVMTLDLVSQLPSETTRAGALLHQIIPFAFRAYRQQLGLEGIHLHDAVAIQAALQQELFETVEMAGDVEISGELTCGATVFDRRPRQAWRNNMEVAIGIDEVAVQDCILRGLKFAGQET